MQLLRAVEISIPEAGKFMVIYTVKGYIREIVDWTVTKNFWSGEKASLSEMPVGLLYVVIRAIWNDGPLTNDTRVYSERHYG